MIILTQDIDDFGCAEFTFDIIKYFIDILARYRVEILTKVNLVAYDAAMNTGQDFGCLLHYLAASDTFLVRTAGRMYFLRIQVEQHVIDDGQDNSVFIFVNVNRSKFPVILGDKCFMRWADVILVITNAMVKVKAPFFSTHFFQHASVQTFSYARINGRFPPRFFKETLQQNICHNNPS